MTEGKILVSHEDHNYMVKFEGDVRLTLCAPLNQYMETIFANDHVDSVIVDLLEAEGVDSTTLGLLAKLALHCKQHFDIAPTLFCTDPSLLQIVESMGLDELFDIVERSPAELEEMEELADVEQDVEQIKKHILEAHKLLVLLNPAKGEEFMDLIASLEDS